MDTMKVPEHILDIVAVQALDYTKRYRERWLGDIPEKYKLYVEENSTHHIVKTSERRALHRNILEKLGQRYSSQETLWQSPLYLGLRSPGCGEKRVGTSLR